MPLALLGGTFDPVHKGHLAIAQAALDDPRFHLDSVIFIPADLPPHKQQQSITPYDDRFAMLELALKEYPRFKLSRMEDPGKTKGQPNYSINTVRRFKREHHLASDDLYFIVGIDSYLQIHTWRDPEALMSECRLVVAHRPGFAKPELPANTFYMEYVSIEVSSTQIRAAVATGGPLEKYVLPAVATYILEHHLYC